MNYQLEIEKMAAYTETERSIVRATNREKNQEKREMIGKVKKQTGATKALGTLTGMGLGVGAVAGLGAIKGHRAANEVLKRAGGTILKEKKEMPNIAKAVGQLVREQKTKTMPVVIGQKTSKAGKTIVFDSMNEATSGKDVLQRMSKARNNQMASALAKHGLVGAVAGGALGQAPARIKANKIVEREYGRKGNGKKYKDSLSGRGVSDAVNAKYQQIKKQRLMELGEDK